MHNYFRKCPKDLFNESMLLKCLGKLCLMILDNEVEGKYIHNGEPFKVCQDRSDGSIYVSNIHIWIEGKRLEFHTPLNCRYNWCLKTIVDGEYKDVFDNQGNYILCVT